MPSSWLIDADYPAGRLVEMTPEDQALHESGQADAAAVDDLQAKQDASVAARMDALRKARTALASGSLFAGLSASERKVIDLLLQDATDA